MSPPASQDPAELPAGYGDLLSDVSAQVRVSRVQAARKVNTELVLLYWRIGRLILHRQAAEGWGTQVIARLAEDLRAEFPAMRGLSARNLTYMRTFAASTEQSTGTGDEGHAEGRAEDRAEGRAEVAQQPVAQLPWGHITVLLDKVPDAAARDFYAAHAVAEGWSRAVLTQHIATKRHERAGGAVTNFAATLPGDSDLLQEIVQDPYNLDFLTLDPGFSERQLEDALIERLTHFLAELGEGFAFVGRQYRLQVGGQEFFADLLFFHLGLRRYVVFELKVVPAAPEHLGKLNFYVNAIDDLMRRPEHGDGATIGILLAATRDDVVVEYALRGMDTPLAVSTYTTEQALPEDIRTSLPSAADLADVVRTVGRPTAVPD